MGITTDRNDPDLHEAKGDGQNRAYLVLSEEDRGRGFVRPLRRSYIHEKCGAETTMGHALCETYAAEPKFYTDTFCVACRAHFPVCQFKWAEDGMEVGS